MAPSLSPGTLNDVVVVNPGGGSALEPRAWFAEFLDVPSSHPAFLAVEKVFRNSVASGCGSGRYCPDLPLTRAELAKLLLRAKHGPTYMPPPARGTIFLDVPRSHPFAGWIEELFNEGIANGCGNGKFCPASSLNRASLAVLLLKGEHGGAFRPSAATGMFHDAPVTDTYAGWIEELARENVTSGCGTKIFCPLKLTSRAEMAIFLNRAFHLP